MTIPVIIKNIKQIDPITETTASVYISFIVLGPTTPDIVQIYASDLSGGLGIPIDIIDITPPENTFETILSLRASTPYRIALCPRTATGNQLDNQIDGEDWRASCTWTTITTKGVSHSSRPKKPEPPIVQSIVPHQVTLNKDGFISISWSAENVVDHFHFNWDEDSKHFYQVEIENRFCTIAPVFAGRIYNFSIQGCQTMDVGKNNCSEYSKGTAFLMPPNTRSLKEFLRLSNVRLNPGIRSLGVVAYGSGIRAMMRL